jgi:hypothetical protein
MKGSGRNVHLLNCSEKIKTFSMTIKELFNLSRFVQSNLSAASNNTVTGRRLLIIESLVQFRKDVIALTYHSLRC